MISLSWLTCSHSLAAAASDLLVPSWTMKRRPWQIHWQIGLQEDLHRCSSPGSRAVGSHTGHVFYCSAPIHDSWQPHTVSISQPNTWQDNSELQCFSSGYAEGVSDQKWRVVSFIRFNCSSDFTDSFLSELCLCWWISLLPWHLSHILPFWFPGVLIISKILLKGLVHLTYKRKRWTVNGNLFLTQHWKINFSSNKLWQKQKINNPQISPSTGCCVGDDF